MLSRDVNTSSVVLTARLVMLKETLLEERLERCKNWVLFGLLPSYLLFEFHSISYEVYFYDPIHKNRDPHFNTSNLHEKFINNWKYHKNNSQPAANNKDASGYNSKKRPANVTRGRM